MEGRYRALADDEVSILLSTDGDFVPPKQRRYMYWLGRNKFLTALELILIIGLPFVWSYVFTLPTCGMFFRCGCTWIWAGGVKRCNIFNPTGPHCPWCAAPPSVGWIPQWGSAVLVIVSLIVFTYFVPKRWRFAVTPFLGLAIWFIFMFIAAISWKAAYNYPYFLWNGPPETTPATTPTPLTHLTEL